MKFSHFSQSIETQCSEWSAGELSSLVSSFSSVLVSQATWSQRIRSQKSKKIIRVSLRLTKAIQRKLSEAILNPSAWRGVWPRTPELSQLARIQTELGKVSLFTSKTWRRQLHPVNKSYFTIMLQRNKRTLLLLLFYFIWLCILV